MRWFLPERENKFQLHKSDSCNVQIINNFTHLAVSNQGYAPGTLNLIWMLFSASLPNSETI